ncbi:MAG: DUF2934 domain-containing protein [Alsobacter sp.]
MSHELEARIREKAYELWESEGRPAGRDQDFWLRAEREIIEQPISAAKALARTVASAVTKRSRKKSQAA